MILLITPLARARDCALPIEEATSEAVTLCEDLAEATAELASHEFKVVVFDDLLPDADGEAAAVVFKHLGSAVPIHVNFAVSGVTRVVSLIRSAVERRKRELASARGEAEQNLRHQLKDSVTALLLSCEMALRVPNLPPLAEDKLQTAEALAREMSWKLGGLT